MVIRCCNTSDVLEVREWMHALALACLYSCHGSAFAYLGSLIPEGNDVKLGCLVVQQVLLISLDLNI